MPQCFVPTTFMIRASRASATSCKAAESTCRYRLESKRECFPSLIFCHSKRATLPSASAARSSVPSLSATFITAPILLLSSSPTSPPSFPVLCFKRITFHTPVAPVALNQLSSLHWTQLQLITDLCLIVENSKNWMLALAPLPKVGRHSYLDDRWFNHFRWNTSPLLHLPLWRSRRVSELAWSVSWRRQVLAAHLKWPFPWISVSPTLKDANPAETLGQVRVRCLALLKKIVRMVARAMRPPMVEAL